MSPPNPPMDNSTQWPLPSGLDILGDPCATQGSCQTKEVRCGWTAPAHLQAEECPPTCWPACICEAKDGMLSSDQLVSLPGDHSCLGTHPPCPCTYPACPAPLSFPYRCCWRRLWLSTTPPLSLMTWPGLPCGCTGPRLSHSILGLPNCILRDILRSAWLSCM